MFKRMTRIVWVSSLALFLAGCSDDDSANGPNGGEPADTRPCTGSTLTAGTFELSFANVNYGYIVHIPPSYDGKKRTPLVLNWHGLTSNAAQQEFFSNMNPVSDEEGFILVYPNSPDASWNAGTCCGGGGRDDVGFARALVAEISSKACIDSKKLYSTGMSNGGFMSHRLGCEAADLFAAIAPVAGKVGIPSCAPSRPVPVMHFHGTADGLVSYDTPALSGENLNVPDTSSAGPNATVAKQAPIRAISKLQQPVKRGRTAAQA